MFEGPKNPLKTNPAENKIFKLEKNLEDLYVIAKETSEYIKNEKIANIALLDRKARNFYVAIREYWKAKMPNEKEPNYYFFNPNGFKESSSFKEIKEEFDSVYKNLNMAKDQPLLVLDVCIHTGESLEPIKSFLQKDGFSDVRVGAIKMHDQSLGGYGQAGFFNWRQGF